MMRFYSLSFDQVLDLPAGAEVMLWKAIDVIEAQESLLTVKSISYPHMTKPGQEKLHRYLTKEAFPFKSEEPQAISLSELSEFLNGR